MYEVTRTIQENKGFGNKEYQNSSSRNNQLHKPGKITLPQWESEPITTTRITYNTWAQADVAHTGSLWAENHSTTQWACGPPNLSADLSTHHKPPVPLPKGCAWLWWNLNKETTGCVYLMRRGTGPLLLDHPTSTDGGGSILKRKSFLFSVFQTTVGAWHCAIQFDLQAGMEHSDGQSVVTEIKKVLRTGLYLDTQHPVGSTVWESYRTLRSRALLEEVSHWEQTESIQPCSTSCSPSLLPPVYMGGKVMSQLLAPADMLCLPHHQGLYPSGTAGQSEPLLPWVALGRGIWPPQQGN